jgi:hypothetical protein
MRKVVLKLTTQKDLIEHESSATTFGELKRELKQVKWSGMRVVERATKATLQMDDAVLPQGEFILFLVPEKVKSGRKTSGGTEELSKPIEECSYNECRSHMSWLNRNKGASLDMSGGTADLQKELKKYYKKNPVADQKPAAKAEAKKPVAKKPAGKSALPAYEPTERLDDEDDEDYEERIAFEKKAFDKKQKKAAEAAKAEEERLAKEKKEKEEKEAAEKAAAAKKPSKESSKKVEKAKKKGLFGRKKTEEAPAPTDPVGIIEEARERINKAVDELVLSAIDGGGVPEIIQFTADDLEKEAKEIHRKLRTSRSQAKYID